MTLWETILKVPLGEENYITFSKHPELVSVYVHIRRYVRGWPTKNGICLTVAELRGLKIFLDDIFAENSKTANYDSVEVHYADGQLTLKKRGNIISLGKDILEVLYNILPGIISLTETHNHRIPINLGELASSVYLALRAEDHAMLKLACEKKHTSEDFKDLIEFLVRHTKAFRLPSLTAEDWKTYLQDQQLPILKAYESLKTKFNPFFIFALCSS